MQCMKKMSWQVILQIPLLLESSGKLSFVKASVGLLEDSSDTFLLCTPYTPKREFTDSIMAILFSTIEVQKGKIQQIPVLQT